MSLAGSLISGLGSIIGGVMTAKAASSAAQAQAAAQQQALAQQQKMFGVAQNALDPYISAGQNNLGTFSNLVNSGAFTTGAANLPGATNFSSSVPTINSNWTSADLESTPGYQFAKSQALKSMTNSAAAKGLGSSGALVKGIGDYSSGLASQTYQQQYQNYVNATQGNFNNTLTAGQQDFTNAFNLGQTNFSNSLSSNNQLASLYQALAQMGLTAGNSLAGAAQGFSGQANTSLTNMGNAQANGILGSNNALVSGIMGATGSANNYLTMGSLLG